MNQLSFKVQSAVLHGVQALPVKVEVLISSGIPSFSIVGMPDTAIQESRERVRAAIKSAGFRVPSDKIVVNLAPSSLRKTGSGFDLPIALALLAATGQIAPRHLERMLVVGELSLEGAVRSVAGLIPYQQCARELECDLLTGVAERGAIPVSGVRCFSIEHLRQITRDDLPAITFCAPGDRDHEYDFADVVGHDAAKRALQVAVAGRHGLIMMGSPGSGKTLLAQCVPSILPPLSEEEKIQTAMIHSVLDSDLHGIYGGLRPFRMPHHSVTAAGLLGGGNPVRPGEVSLAHNGVLFIDELSEMQSNVLQQLRQPLEEGIVHITRAEGSYVFPANFMFVAATNLCPCGYYGDEEHECSCSPGVIQRYQSKIGGPLMDRIDIRVDVERSDLSQLSKAPVGKSSAELREEIVAAREFTRERTSEEHRQESSVCSEGKNGVTGGASDGRRTNKLLELFERCQLTRPAHEFLDRAVATGGLSTRSVVKMLSIARTIADLDRSYKVDEAHIAEAYTLRFQTGSFAG
ncbi:YifB family Mg chelatase-like AAA ATPase [Anaerotardibacter muris]|uniref:YifB family Mg chelatase-like AAA ATPase n=1 Tax=Anaerotardibacter muris TaxID=2941505 RepID=UPI00203EA009|nr:YifB family Mg chelatase-like AAA ATPase [Anaerotardibacter muris]